MTIIGHIDADCFYVSCERVRDSRLKGKPVGVLGNQGACVIARSYEMRPYGVKVGMPVWQAKKLCPEGIYVKRDFHWYEILSRQMQELLHEYSDVVEYYSVDESFVDFGNLGENAGAVNAGNSATIHGLAEVTGYIGGHKNLQATAKKIQQQMLKEIGVPVSVGLSLTRTLAKMASEKNKPLGIMVVTKENLREFLANCSPDEIAGIGSRLIKRIPHLKTTLDYINEPRQKIRQLLHKPGEQFWYELQGIPILPIKSARPARKILSRGGSIWGHHKDPKYVWGFLVRNLERLVSQMVKEQIEILDLSLVLITSQSLYFKAGQKLSDYTNSFSALIQALKALFKKAFRDGYLYSYVHIIANELRPENSRQLNLFTEGDQKQREYNEKQRKLFEAKQLINKKFGPFTVRSGSTAYVPQVFEDETSNYEICDIEGKICF